MANYAARVSAFASTPVEGEHYIVSRCDLSVVDNRFNPGTQTAQVVFHTDKGPIYAPASVRNEAYEDIKAVGIEKALDNLNQFFRGKELIARKYYSKRFSRDVVTLSLAETVDELPY